MLLGDAVAAVARIPPGPGVVAHPRATSWEGRGASIVAHRRRQVDQVDESTRWVSLGKAKWIVEECPNTVIIHVHGCIFADLVVT